jgi:hypothetical protein
MSGLFLELPAFVAEYLNVEEIWVKPFLRAANLSWDLTFWKRRHPFCF